MIEILSDEALTGILRMKYTEVTAKYILRNAGKAIAQAQLENTIRQVKEWGEEPCNNSKHFRIGSMRFNCFQCWEELGGKEE